MSACVIVSPSRRAQTVAHNVSLKKTSSANEDEMQRLVAAAHIRTLSLAVISQSEADAMPNDLELTQRARSWSRACSPCTRQVCVCESAHTAVYCGARVTRARGYRASTEVCVIASTLDLFCT